MGEGNNIALLGDTRRPSLDAAMKTSIKLCEYDDILNPRSVVSLLCLTSLKNKSSGICSKAFVKPISGR